MRSNLGPVEFLVTNEFAGQRGDQVPVLLYKSARPRPQSVGNPNSTPPTVRQFANATASGTRLRHAADQNPEKGYRENLREARKLADKVVPIAEIANKINRSASVVRGWLKKGE